MNCRLCIVGNSHITALKLAWKDAGKCTGSFTTTYFASHVGSIRHLEVEGRALIPTTEQVQQNFLMTSAGKDRICADDFDAFIVVGLGNGLAHAMQIYKGHRLSMHINSPTQYPISRATLGVAVKGLLEGGLAMQTIAKLRSISNAPIAYVPDPFPREAITTTDDYGDYWRCEGARNTIFDLYASFLKDIAEDPTFRLVWQPEETIVNRMFTKDAFILGSFKLSKEMNTKHTNQDMFHANPEYGVRILRVALPLLLEASPVT